MFLPSARLKQGGVRISPLDSRATSKRPARIAGKRILPAAKRDTSPLEFLQEIVPLLPSSPHFRLPSTHSLPLFLSLCLSPAPHERDYDACAPSRCRLSGLNRSSSSAVDSPDERRARWEWKRSVIFKSKLVVPFRNPKQVRVFRTAYN